MPWMLKFLKAEKFYVIKWDMSVALIRILLMEKKVACKWNQFKKKDFEIAESGVRSVLAGWSRRAVCAHKSMSRFMWKSSVHISRITDHHSHPGPGVFSRPGLLLLLLQVFFSSTGPPRKVLSMEVVPPDRIKWLSTLSHPKLPREQRITKIGEFMTWWSALSLICWP